MTTNDHVADQQPASHASHHSGTASTMKAARAALMLVCTHSPNTRFRDFGIILSDIRLQVPILGLHFMLLPMRPEEGTPLDKLYQVVSAVTSSFQVSVIDSVWTIRDKMWD